MNDKMKNILFYVKIVFIVCLFAWIAFKFDYNSAKKIISTAKAGWAVIAVIFSLLSVVLVSIRWKMIIRGFWSGPRSSVGQLFFFNLLAAFYTLFLPTSIAGEAVRVWRLAKNEDSDYAKATFTAIIDRMIGISTWFIIFLLMPSLFPKNRLLLLILLIPVGLYFFKDKIAYKEKKLIDFSRHHPIDIVYAVLFSVFCQLAYIVTGYSVLRCFNVNIAFLSSGGLLSAGTLVALIPISLLGFGAREGFFIAVLPMYGAQSTQAVLFTSFMVFLNYLGGMVGGVIELMNTGWKLSSLKKPDVTDIK